MVKTAHLVLAGIFIFASASSAADQPTIKDMEQFWGDQYDKAEGPADPPAGSSGER